MSINLDVRTAIRHPDLARLVQAVVDADEHDEADWIEWKSTLDLSSKQGSFPIARTILGMANRMPASASLTCEGLGYIVVGAEPGNIAGVTSVDPADLDSMLEPWLGGPDGPRYTPNYVRMGAHKVFVVTVEPPHNGDPVYMLCKEFAGARDGEVFVRKSGRTERANSADMRALHARMQAASGVVPELEIALVGDVPLSWFEPSSVDPAVAAWVSGRRREMESAARAEERRRHPEPEPTRPPFRPGANVLETAASIARYQSELERISLKMHRLGVLGLGGEQDTRTLDEYLGEVDKWANKAEGVGAAVLASRYLDGGHGSVAVQVHNPSSRFLPKVRLEVHFEWEPLRAAKPDFDGPKFPARPREYGEPKPAPTLSLGPFVSQYQIPQAPTTSPPRRSWTEKGSVKIVFAVGDLRQEETDTSEKHYLLLPERPPDGVLHGTWKATVPDMDGVMRGTLEVPVQAEPVNLRELLD